MRRIFFLLSLLLGAFWFSLGYAAPEVGLAVVTNKPPVISGSPTLTVTVGSSYSFTPTASDANGDKLTFSITNKPAWATFDAVTGKLSGKPAATNVGTTTGITIKVTDGKSTAVSLPAFSLTVVQPLNLARQFGIATQGKDYDSASAASLAIDGNTATFNHTTCDATNNWWQVALPSALALNRVVITNRPNWSSRIEGTTVYISNSPYKGTLNSAELIGTLKALSTPQEILLPTPRTGMYVIVKAAGSNCLHMSEAEVYGTGALPEAPVFSKSAYAFDLSYKATVGTVVGAVKAVDYQANPLTYSLDNTAVPFAIDSKGTLTLKGALKQSTYSFNVKVSDGKNTSSAAVTINAPINLTREFGVAIQGEDYDSASAASLAIDGNPATFNHTSCDAVHNWWQVALPNPTQVKRILISNRPNWTSRIEGAKVYVTTKPYTGTLPTADLVGTLKALSTPQEILLTTPKTGAYLLVKAAADNCLHMSEVEVYGQPPVAPALDQKAYSYQISNTTTVGKPLGAVKAVDYQLEKLTYQLEGSSLPFAIDATGKMSIKSTLQAGKTYSFNIAVSDGTNITRAPVTVKVTSLTAVEDALRTGDIGYTTADELLAASITEVASKKTGIPLLKALYGTSAIAYTPGKSTQLMDIKPWVESAFPILMGAKGNTLAMAGTQGTARYAAFGVPPTDLFKASQSLGFEAPFGRLLAWLFSGDALNTTSLTTSRTVALSMTSSGSRNNFKAWIAQKYPTWKVVDCNTVSALATCYSPATLIVTDGGSSTETDAAAVRQAVSAVMTAGKPVLYLHTGTWGSNKVSETVAALMNFSMPYGGNWWAIDAASWTNVSAMQTAIWDQQGLGGIEKMLAHFKAMDYSMAADLTTEFYAGANKVRSAMTALDENKVNLFTQAGTSRVYRLLALLGDSYRQSVRFPMDKNTTDGTTFLKSLFADHAVYNYRKINPVQADMGNFSRSNFSHITPVSKTVKLTSRRNFRATGAYALPGKTVTVKRLDTSKVATRIFVNTLRSGSTHEMDEFGYSRPKYLQSASMPIVPGETIEFTSPYGGPLEVSFDTNDLPVEFAFTNVGEHPFWDGAEDNALFVQKLAQGDYDWAELVAPSFEVHSTLEKMRESMNDARWGSADKLAAATMRYVHNFPHVLAGFKGPGIDVVPEIQNFATTKGFTIENLDMVKHMNADQATCGYGCSGNPYDAYWNFDPVGHGDIHELGHGLESGRFRFSGWEVHGTTNPYSYYTKSHYFQDTGGDPDCQNLPFKDVFTLLQTAVKQSNPQSYLKSNLWGVSDWSKQVSMTLQMMMAVEDQGKLIQGWHLLPRLHILEREFNRARADATTWGSKKASLGFSTYTLEEANAISNDDWMLIAVSVASGLDFRSYMSMWGIAYSTKAATQVAGFNYTAAPRQFYISSSNGYCKGEGFDGRKLPVDGKQVWPLP